jgi:hypothetical protein
MSINFSKNRLVLPPSSLGQNLVAERKVAEASGRAAEKTRIALSVDSNPSRIWLRNPRGTIACPCSTFAGEHSPLSPNETSTIILDGGEGDDIRAVDSGFPLLGPKANPGDELPLGQDGLGFESNWVNSLQRLLVGDGRRCGLCISSGWIDGYNLWGGQRYLCCAADTLYVTVDDSSACDVDLNSPTPTFVGPGQIVWNLELMPNINILDVIRVRDGLNPALQGWTLEIVNEEYPDGIDLATTYDFGIGTVLPANQMPTQIILTLEPNVKVSHVELVMRSESLINVQLPNLSLTASTELVAPYIQEEFEIDNIITWLERGSLIEIPGINGRLGSVWLVQDVNINRTVSGVTWQISGSARNIQPNEIFACVSLEDALTIGIQDSGLGTRGLESTGAGQPSGVPSGASDESFAAAKRGESKRQGGGSSASMSVISLNPSPSRDYK